MALLAVPASQTIAAELSIMVRNDGNSSFALTPVWFGFDDGSFDLFDPGAAASASLEALAEGGDTSGLAADFGAATQGVIVSNDGAAPVIEPGETASFTISLDTTQNRYFSYASMVIPSNDAFISTPESSEVFDLAGNFIGGGNSADVPDQWRSDLGFWHGGQQHLWRSIQLTASSW